MRLIVLFIITCFASSALATEVKVAYAWIHLNDARRGDARVAQQRDREREVERNTHSLSYELGAASRIQCKPQPRSA
jgi:hypothetical protein